MVRFGRYSIRESDFKLLDGISEADFKKKFAHVYKKKAPDKRDGLIKEDYLQLKELFTKVKKKPIQEVKEVKNENKGEL